MVIGVDRSGSLPRNWSADSISGPAVATTSCSLARAALIRLSETCRATETATYTSFRGDIGASVTAGLTFSIVASQKSTLVELSLALADSLAPGPVVNA